MMTTRNRFSAFRAIGATRDTGRPDNDFYETVPEAINTLLAVERFPGGLVWEPACGTGAIVKPLREAGYKVVATDLFTYDVDFRTVFGLDFLEADPPAGVRHIVTNPPFSLQTEFAEHGISLLPRTEGKFVLLARLAYLEGIERKPIFENSPLSVVYVFSRRLPLMHRPNYNGPKSTSMLPFAWFVWNYRYDGEPRIRWVDWKDYQ